jgi:hypothetical protein
VGYVYQISDGAVQTAGVSARVKTGTGSWGAAAGTLDCDTTSGAWTYTPTQGETNAEAFSVSLYKASCSGVGMTVITGKSPTAGYVAPDWGQVTGASSTVNLSGTTVKAVTDAVAFPSSASINITGNITGNLSGSVGSVTGAVGSVTGNVGGSVASVTGAVGSVTGNVGGNVTGSVGSVASGVTVTTNNDKTGYSLTQAFPSNFSSLAITVGGAVTAGTVSDKTGYSLSSSQTFSTTGSVGSVTGAVGSVTSGVTIATNNDKTGYSLTQAFPSNFSSLGINSSGHISRVVLVDTTTVNSDMRGTDGAALASVWTSTIAGRIDMPLSDIPTAAENADAVWDEAYAAHTAAGSFGKLMDTLRKSNYVTEGTVASGQTPTTTVFRSNLTAPSGTYDHQTMLFLTGILAGESKPVDTYSATNGTFTLAEPLTSAPTVGDEFALLPDHVHPITAIAAGVRTELAVELARIDVTVGSRLADADYTAPLDAAGTRSAIGLASANLDTQLDALPTAAEIDTQLSGTHGGGAWGSIGSGSGAYTFTVTVDDGTNPLQNATVRLVEGVNNYVAVTNASGVAVFALDAATYSVAISKAGYSFTPTTKVVANTTSQTYSMSAVTPTLPAAANLSTGTAICYGTTGLPLQGVVVTIQQVQGTGTDGSAYDGDTFTLTSNASGVISHNGFVRGATYSIRRGVRGEAKSFTVPNAVSFDLSEIVGRD